MSGRRTCWVVTDGAAGNENQALAVATAIGLAPRVIRVALRWPWRWLAPTGPRDVRLALATSAHAELSPPWPDVVIGCGRAAALVTRGIARLSRGSTRVVQILDPRRHRQTFDVLIVPEHDGLTGDNVIACVGALNAIDDRWLEQGRARFPQFGALPGPRTAVLVGGPVRGFALDADYVEGMLGCLSARHARDGGSFLVTVSRRTPPAVAARLRPFFSSYPGTFRDHGDVGENPYPGLMGWADRIVVTPDSANLLSEACATGAPVLAWRPTSVPGKLGRLAGYLINSGRLRPLDGDDLDSRPAPLRELARVAEQVSARLDAASGRTDEPR